MWGMGEGAAATGRMWGDLGLSIADKAGLLTSAEKIWELL